MDLRAYGRVLWRFKLLVLAGAVCAFALSLLSYYKVTFVHGKPKLSPRAEQVWQADATIFLTTPGFPAGRTDQPVVVQKVGNQVTTVPKYTNPGTFIGLAPLYARLANSDAVKQLMLRTGGPLEGTVTTIPTADTTYGTVSGLPMISIFGKASTPAKALLITKRQMDAFLTYVRSQQAAAGIGDSSRVDFQVLNAPGDTTLLVPRKKTLPIVVLLGVLFATVALAFVLDNARPKDRAPKVKEVESAAIQDIGRSA